MRAEGPACRTIARNTLTCAALAISLALAGGASAQVIEIAETGEVTVHDRPAVYTAEGAQPIETTPRPAARAPAPTARPAAAIAPLHAAAAVAAVSPALIEAVAWQESRFRPGVVSRAGAIGEMQLMPATARMLGVNPFDTADNYRGGAVYLGGLLKRYSGDLLKTLAAYNAGPGAVDRYGGVPPYRETRAYVSAILDRLSRTAMGDLQSARKGL